MHGTNHGVLPVLGVWGANAAGKSNLLTALVELRDMVRRSFAHLRPGQPLPWTPWRMDRAPDAPPTRISVDFTVPGEHGSPVRHHYAVAHRADGIQSEALYSWPKGTRRTLFQRNKDEDPIYYFGPSLRGTREAVQATRDNSLFLSAAAQFNHPQLLPIHRVLAEGLVVRPFSFLERAPIFDPGSPLLAPQNHDLVLRLLQAADIDVHDFQVHARPDVQKAILDLIKTSPGITEDIRQLEDADPPLELRLRHGAPGEPGWDCPPELESAGTLLLLRLFEGLIPVLETSVTWVVDELDKSLHPDLCREVVRVFTDPSTNPNGAQLLFTTHSRDLLDELRTDEVILVAKEPDGSSSISAASDFKGLRTRDHLQVAHRQGKLGAVPILLGMGAAARELSGKDEADVDES